MRITVPADIKKYVTKNVVKKITRWLLVTLFIGVLIILLGERCFSRLNALSKYTIYAVLLVWPFFSSKIYKLFDSSWYGEIVDIKFEYSNDNEHSFKPTRENRFLKETVYFSIKTPEGKIIRKKAFENRANSNNNSKYYKVGDKALHIYGTDYIQIKNENAERVICVVCGTAEPADQKQCTTCGHTLNIDFTS